MELVYETLGDVYGPVLYRIPAPGEEASAFDPAAIKWLPKPGGKITFILPEEEFRDKNLTGLLKNIVAALKIPFESCSFGVIRSAPWPANFAACPTPLAMIFGMHYCAEKEENPFPVNDKTVYRVPALSEMVNNQDKKRIAWNTMKLFIDQLA